MTPVTISGLKPNTEYTVNYRYGSGVRQSYTDKLRSRLGHPKPTQPNYRLSLMTMIARDACDRIGFEWRVRNNLLSPS